MSTKSAIFHSDFVYLYEDVFYENIAFVRVSGSGNACVELDFNKSQQVTIAIPDNIMDEMAIAWIKERKLQGALGGPVGKEWGSPDCEYD